MGIFRGASPERSVELATRAWDAGIDVIEIPIQTPSAVPSLEAVVLAGRERGMPVGAGTITSIEQVDRCLELGVAFTVAPGLDLAVLRHSARVGLPHLPGVATASEVQAVAAEGLTWAKAFPASVLGPEWIASMKSGPFPEMRFVATGGVGPINASDFLAAGASMVAVGSSIGSDEGLVAVARLASGAPAP